MSGQVIGWGTAVPPTVVTNDDLSRRLDTSDCWIVERTGIRERHHGGTTTALASEAASAALVAAGITADEVSVLLLATTTPDRSVPASAATVQSNLGLRCGAADINAACSGFVYAFVLGHALCGLGHDTVLVVAADTLSSITDPEDRTLGVLVGDGAGAVVLRRGDGDRTLLGWHLGCDGDGAHLLYRDHGAHLRMDGKEMFRRAVRMSVDSCQAALDQAGLRPADISLLVPHQANLRIIQAIGERLGIPLERTSVVIDRFGNTSASSIPLALADALDRGRLQPGDVVLLAGVGAGMTVGSAVVRWQ